MTNTMKKTLIPALLVISSALTLCLRSTGHFPSAPSIVISGASQLFWRFWGTLLNRELAQWTSADSQITEEVWPPELRNETLFCLFFQIFLNQAFDSSRSTPEKKDALVVSISEADVRRIMERGFRPLITSHQRQN